MSLRYYHYDDLHSTVLHNNVVLHDNAIFHNNTHVYPRLASTAICPKWGCYTKFYGPFKVLQKIGKVAYKLELPTTAQFHPVFHVSQLKKCHSTELTIGTLPLCDTKGSLAMTPYKLLDRRLAKQGNRAVVYSLV
ncbi:hypothetical protein Tco_0834366 [Tanacetum coccineum]